MRPVVSIMRVSLRQVFNISAPELFVSCVSTGLGPPTPFSLAGDRRVTAPGSSHSRGGWTACLGVGRLGSPPHCFPLSWAEGFSSVS